MKTLVDRLREAPDVSSLDERQRELVEAAWEDCLDAVLEGDHPTIEAGTGVNDLTGSTAASLAWIEARGFRGIATGDRLTFAAGTGLTLVLGRNGSGKSSYVEALEVALRGRSARWEERPNKEWVQGWANLHHPEDKPVSVRVGFHVDQQGERVLERRWDNRTVGVDASTEDFGELSLDALGWRDAVETTPPVLSYSELGRLADRKPSELYDALERLLGLESVHAVRDRLGHARSANEKPMRDLKKNELPRLVAALKNSADPRARTAEAALSKKTWDLAALDDLALGLEDKPESASLRDLSRLRAPSVGEDLPGRLRSALTSIEQLAGASQVTNELLANLLDHALLWHAKAGESQACPVCEGPTGLDADWRERAQAQVDEARSATSALGDARTLLRGLEGEARGALRTPIPAVLASLESVELPIAVRQRWLDWSAAAEGPLSSLADALESLGPPLRQDIETVRNLATSRLDAAEEAWKPLRRTIAGFVEHARTAQVAKSRVKDLTKAKAWVDAFAESLREERFAPIAERATQVWARLRQSSNVALASVKLEGKGNRRHLVLETTVDDAPATALGVMSQGEINALGLALFVPRAMSEASPFRFLVVDDPVQAMDPHKVDGLAMLLSDLAQERQVIVFTHDTRLREALDRMQLPYRALEVQREPGSVVKVEAVDSPVEQYLKDAFRVYKAEDHLGPGVVAGLVPAHCRSAVEAACNEVIRRRRIEAGHAHADVEQLIADTRNLNLLLALALFDNENAGNKVFGRLKQMGGPEFIDTLKATKQAHGRSSWSGSWSQLVQSTEKLTDAIRAAG